MGDATTISWTDATWNPVRGCSRVSEGCRNCYAERVASRFSDEGQPYHGLADRTRSGSKWTGEVRFINQHLADPLRWKRPRRIFVNSMSDLFHEKLTNEQIAAVFGVMAASPQHTFQVLTKRAARMREWFDWASDFGASTLYGYAEHAISTDDDEGRILGNLRMAKAWPAPLPNVWLGVSIENQDAAAKRIPDLLATPAAVRFLSCEPLLGAVDIYRWMKCDDCTTDQPDHCPPDRAFVDWVIAGCESGPGARACDVAWLRSLRDQCEAASAAFFLKQATNHQRGMFTGDELVRVGEGSRAKHGGVIELPYLDGVQHAAFPDTRTA